MHWFYLGLAIVTEVAGTTAIKYTEGFSKWFPSLSVVCLYVLSTYMLALAVEEIDLGVAYSIWAGVGIVVTVLAGYFLFKETLSIWKLVFIATIIIGVIGLYLAD